MKRNMLIKDSQVLGVSDKLFILMRMSVMDTTAAVVCERSLL